MSNTKSNALDKQDNPGLLKKDGPDYFSFLSQPFYAGGDVLIEKLL